MSPFAAIQIPLRRGDVAGRIRRSPTCPRLLTVLSTMTTHVVEEAQPLVAPLEGPLVRRNQIRLASLVASMLLLSQGLGLATGLATRAGAATAPRGDLAKAGIVFARLQGTPENHEIWTMGRRGGNQHRLTNNDVGDFDPVWSPDGSRIAWVRYPQAACNCGPSDVWLMDADGTDPYNLTDDAAAISRPTWSPDGTQIAFTRGYEIWMIDADGSDEHRI